MSFHITGVCPTNALVTVYETGGAVLASIFTDSGLTTPKPNPFRASGASFSFYCATDQVYEAFGLIGYVTGPDGATDGNMAVFDGSSGIVIRDGGAPGGGGTPSVFTVLTSAPGSPTDGTGWFFDDGGTPATVSLQYRKGGVTYDIPLGTI